METLNNVVNYKKRLAVLTLSVALLGSLFGCSSSKVELKAKEFETPVNKEISLKADTYLKDVKKDSKVSFENSKLDTKKLGTYDVKIKYDGKEYAMKIKVVDKEKPVIAINKKLFVFDLKTSVKDVNKAINKEIKITDNYDKIFNDLNVISSIPKEEKEVVCKLNVKDTSDNVSESVEIKVQFTKNGKEKTGLKQETKTVETTVNIKENEKSLANGKSDTPKKEDGEKTSSSTNNSDKPKDNDKSNSDKDSNKKPNNGSGNVANNGNQGGNGSNSNTGSNGGSTNKPTEKPNKPSTPNKPNKPNKPSEPPRPNEQPKPDKPVQKPQLTVANAPDWMRNAGFIKLFNTDDEAYEWANNQIRTEGSPYYGMTSIVTGDLSDDDNFTGVIWGVNIY